MPKYIFILLLLWFPLKDGHRETTQPNIVFIFADDMTYTAISALGNDEINTPNLDRLVRGGTTFTHAFNMGGWNGAICVASRAMIISGRSLWEANQFRKEWIKGVGTEKSWGKLMKSAGYETFMTGKWHLDARATEIFQNVVHVRPGMPGDAWNRTPGMEIKIMEASSRNIPMKDIMPLGYNRPLDENDTLWSASDTSMGGYWEGGKHWSEVLKEDALGFLERSTEKEKPFFMYLAFNAPHDPRQAPKEYLGQYPLDRISLPKSWLPEYPFKDSIGNGPDLRDEALAPFPRTAYAIKKHTQEYYALISHMDQQIGEILNKLEANDGLKNTFVIFTADHGLAMGRHGLMGKQSLFDHSIRVPFMVMGPGIPAGKKIEEPIYLQDAMATSLELAGIKKPDYVFFNSLIDLAKGKQPKSHYREIYGAYTDTQRMIRKNGFKLIAYPKLKKLLLFDLKKDPEEQNDLASRSAYHMKVDSLFKDLLKLQQQFKDTVDIASIRPIK
ncbi:MAG: sulfatase-like hydrolase/transferase [Flavobacteriaceae bacterium]